MLLTQSNRTQRQEASQRKGLRKHNTHSVLRQHLSLLLNGETPETFPLKTEDTDAHFTTTNIVLEGLASETGQEKTVKVSRVVKE